ncbi:hypothetical protein GH714_037566 [Hevea brasiliensis]|uniref:Protein kinase domain-containing protein n=1 Tax=Hevea brasiliensis TaxID=3981 RepID=A0A6A6LTC3_HEVBR|nr:hypothetical protein GH714_037566 [Hevea brasiliensis]
MDWTRGRTIGRGSTSTVSIAALDQSGQAFAVKSAELSQSEFLQREQRILSALSCPQIIAYKGFDITRENGKLLYNIFLEYAPGGTIMDAIRKHGGWLDESFIRSYTRQILLGLHHLHSNGILHRDIKCHNILVTSDGAKIADLGCAKQVDEVVATKTPIAGTPVYMAPEVVRGEHQGFPADVWALGCTVVEMATGRAPWTNISDPVSALYQIGFSGAQFLKYSSWYLNEIISSPKIEVGSVGFGSPQDFALLNFSILNNSILFLRSIHALPPYTEFFDIMVQSVHR